MIFERVAHEPEPPSAATTSRVGRLQLAVIGAVVVLAAGIGLVLGLTILSERGQSALGGSAAYVPADAVMYMEARLDLPAGQRESLRAILERFPAVNADEVLGSALAQTLDDALASSDTPFTYSGDIAPWFDGRLAVSLLDYPAPPDPATTDPMSVELPSMAFLVGVRDATAAGTFADAMRAELLTKGASFVSSDHLGTTIWTLDLDATSTPVPMVGVGFAYALTADQLLLANGRDSVERLLDVHAGSGDSLDGRSELADLGPHLPAEWAGFVAVDLESMLVETRAQIESTSPELADALSGYLDSVPTLVVQTIGFEADAVRLDAATSMPGGDMTPSNSQRQLAASVPSDAIFFADGGNVGTGLAQAITGLRSSLVAVPGLEDVNRQIEGAEAALGADFEEFVSWIGSAAMAAGWDGQQAWFGLVLEAADPDAAAQRLGQLRALIELFAANAPIQVEVTTETVNGVDVTSISATDPMGGGVPVTRRIVQYALSDGTAFIGFGDRFVARALQVAPGASLADSDRFGAALDRFGGQDNAGAFFLDLTALRGAVEEAVPDVDAVPGYASEIRPNLVPLDYFAGVTRVESGAVVSRFGLVLTP